MTNRPCIEHAHEIKDLTAFRIESRRCLIDGPTPAEPAQIKGDGKAAAFRAICSFRVDNLANYGLQRNRHKQSAHDAVIRAIKLGRLPPLDDLVSRLTAARLLESLRFTTKATQQKTGWLSTHSVDPAMAFATHPLISKHHQPMASNYDGP